MASLLIRNGTLLDPSTLFERERDVLIRDGRIVAHLARGETPAVRPDETLQTVDAAGCYVAPGLIDVHVHLREPGDEEEETIASGSRAAAAGGFTTVCCMPNTRPALDNEGQIEFVTRQAERAGIVRVLPVGAITKGRSGKELAEMAGMKACGAVAFSDDGQGVADASIMRRALQYAKMLDAVIMQHCEEPTLAGGSMHAGKVADELGLRGIPAEAEQLMLARDVLLNRAIGCRYHAQHLSTAESVEIVRRAKRDGLPVTAEIAPHHLLLTDEACRSYDPVYKMNPPLRSAEDVAACISGVVDGTIDLLATDHAPHRPEEKACEFQEAAFGIVSLECALGLYGKALIEPGHVPWIRLIDLMSTRPATLLGLDAGTLAVGAPGDVTIIDPKRRWRVDVGSFAGKSRNCPFDGWELTGRATHTIVAGRTVWRLEGRADG